MLFRCEILDDWTDDKDNRGQRRQQDWISRATLNGSSSHADLILALFVDIYINGDARNRNVRISAHQEYLECCRREGWEETSAASIVRHLLFIVIDDFSAAWHDDQDAIKLKSWNQLVKGLQDMLQAQGDDEGEDDGEDEALTAGIWGALRGAGLVGPRSVLTQEGTSSSASSSDNTAINVFGDENLDDFKDLRGKALDARLRNVIEDIWLKIPVNRNIWWDKAQSCWISLDMDGNLDKLGDERGGLTILLDTVEVHMETIMDSKSECCQEAAGLLISHIEGLRQEIVSASISSSTTKVINAIKKLLGR
ncbi:hypothetical protein WJX72_011356 [[Myrmecia] bisecta]|uniref:Uncharacterized protein n=1 Tax=[Myrmecia] bisecta TaxID=41462 RepID=A0AAW1QGI8_9CHLO